METLMIQAIRQFKKEHRGCEIRSIATAEGTGKAGKWEKVLFNIQYVDIKENNVSGEGYADCYIEVSKMIDLAAMVEQILTAPQQRQQPQQPKQTQQSIINYSEEDTDNEGLEWWQK